MAEPTETTGVPIGLYSVLSIIDLRIKRERKPWKSVRAMAWRPEELAEFLQKMLGRRPK